MEFSLLQFNRLPPPCGDCAGVCCSGGGAGGRLHVELLPEEVAAYPDAVSCLPAEFRSGMMLPTKADGSCLHLVDGRCGIYERRPKACRMYNCVSDYVLRGSVLCDLKNEVVALIKRKYPCVSRPRRALERSPPLCVVDLPKPSDSVPDFDTGPENAA